MSVHGTLPAARGSASGWARVLLRVAGPAGLAMALVPVLAALALLAVTATRTVAGPADPDVAVAVALLVTAGAYGPTRRALLRTARRLREGPRASQYGALSGLAAAFEAGEDDRDRLGSLVATVARAFGLTYVGVEVDRPGGGGILTVAHGTTTGAPRRRPLTYRGEEIGRLLLAPRGPGPATSVRDERLLEDLVRQAAAAVRADRLAEQSAAARRRLVAAREEERRRIRGALHDDLGPLLGHLVADVEAARPLLRTAPAAADSVVADLAVRLGGAVTEVRRVVHDLRPPALDGRGLLGALDQQADRMRSRGVATEVVGDPGAARELPAAVEVSAYRIAVEALDNVARHAAAATCRLTVTRDGDRLVLAVVDDGVGVAPHVQAGAGLSRIRERALELGGSVEVGCPPDGGTAVVAVLPAVPDAEPVR